MWKETAKNSSIVLVGVVLSRLFVFLYNTIIIRQLSVADYALFAFARAVFNWVLVFSHLDLYAAVSCNVSKFKSLGRMNQAWSYYCHARWMVSIFAFIGVIVALLIASRQAGYPLLFLSVFMLSLVPMSLVTVNDGYLKGLEKFKLSAFVEISGGLSKLLVLGLAVLILGTVNFADVLVTFAVASLLMFLTSNVCILRLKSVKTKAVEYKVSIAKNLFGYSKWVCLTDLMNTGILLSGNLIISYRNPSDLALFNVVILIYSIFQMGFGTITTVLIPQISRQSARNEKIRMLAMREFLVVMFLTVVLIVFLNWFPWRYDVLVFLFNKPDYLDAFKFLSILMISFPFRLFSVANKGILQGIGQPKLVALASVAVLMTNILMFTILYNLYSLAGAMLAMVCAYLVEYAITTIVARRALACLFPTVTDVNP